MEEISTSFCFICLLHLANEKGLTVEVGEDEDNAEARIADTLEKSEESKVGNIWGLKVRSANWFIFWGMCADQRFSSVQVRRDPTAIPSA